MHLLILFYLKNKNIYIYIYKICFYFVLYIICIIMLYLVLFIHDIYFLYYYLLYSYSFLPTMTITLQIQCAGPYWHIDYRLEQFSLCSQWDVCVMCVWVIFLEKAIYYVMRALYNVLMTTCASVYTHIHTHTHTSICTHTCWVIYKATGYCCLWKSRQLPQLFCCWLESQKRLT